MDGKELMWLPILSVLFIVSALVLAAWYFYGGV
jgi:hypothetical protein